MKHPIASLTLIAASMLTGAAASAADPITRYPLGGGSTFPISRAVEVPAGYSLIFHSGLTPAPANDKAEKGSPAYWGDTKTQALSVFGRMKESLESLGLAFERLLSSQLRGDSQKKLLRGKSTFSSRECSGSRRDSRSGGQPIAGPSQ